MHQQWGYFNIFILRSEGSYFRLRPHWPYGRLKNLQTRFVCEGRWVIIGRHWDFTPAVHLFFTDSTKEIILKQVHDNERRYFSVFRTFIGRTEEKTTSYTQRANGRTIHGHHFTRKLSSLFIRAVSHDGTQHSDRYHCGFQWVAFHAFSFSVLQLLQMCFFCSQTLITCNKLFFFNQRRSFAS